MRVEIGLLQAAGYTTVRQDELDFLREHCFSPLSGMRDLAKGFIDEWGHDPADHPELVALMEIELSGALVEAAADLMREHGLPDLRVEPAPTHTPPTERHTQ